MVAAKFTNWSTLRNPKLEFRNPKQIQNSNFQNSENAPLVSCRVLSFVFGTFDIVSDFELRITSFVSAYEVARHPLAVVGSMVPASVREDDIMYQRTSQGEPMGGPSIR